MFYRLFPNYDWLQRPYFLPIYQYLVSSQYQFILFLLSFPFFNRNNCEDKNVDNTCPNPTTLPKKKEKKEQEEIKIKFETLASTAYKSECFSMTHRKRNIQYLSRMPNREWNLQQKMLKSLKAKHKFSRNRCIEKFPYKSYYINSPKPPLVFFFFPLKKVDLIHWTGRRVGKNNAIFFMT